MTTKTITALAFSALVVTASLSTAAAAHPKHADRRHEPPKAAIQACDGLKEGETVSFETPRGDTLEATCKKIAGELAAVPANHAKRPHKEPDEVSQ